MGVALFVLFNEARQPHRPKPSSPAFPPPIARSDMRQWLNQHGERPLLWLAAAFVAAVVVRKVLSGRKRRIGGRKRLLPSITPIRPFAASGSGGMPGAIAGSGWHWALRRGCPPFGCFSCWSGPGVSGGMHDGSCVIKLIYS